MISDRKDRVRNKFYSWIFMIAGLRFPPNISTHKTPERHENIRLIRKNTDTSDTLGTS